MSEEKTNQNQNLLTTVVVALLCFLEVMSIKVNNDSTKISLETKKQYFNNKQKSSA
jgi:hypothetical protein